LKNCSDICSFKELESDKGEISEKENLVKENKIENP